MPKVSLDELDSLSEESNFQKVRKKGRSFKEAKTSDKKSKREKKIDY